MTLARSLVSGVKRSSTPMWRQMAAHGLDGSADEVVVEEHRQRLRPEEVQVATQLRDVAADGGVVPVPPPAGGDPVGLGLERVEEP